MSYPDYTAVAEGLQRGIDTLWGRLQAERKLGQQLRDKLEEVVRSTNWLGVGSCCKAVAAWDAAHRKEQP